MPNVKNETQHKGEFLVTRAPGHMSFEEAVLAAGNVVADGRLLVKSAGKVIPSSGDVNTEGSDDAGEYAGFAYGAHDATDGDVRMTIVARLAEVNGAEIDLGVDADSTGADDAVDAIKASLESKFLLVR